VTKHNKTLCCVEFCKSIKLKQHLLEIGEACAVGEIKKQH